MDQEKEAKDSDLWQALQKKSKNLAYHVSDLSDCDQEPIAFCGAIQPFGILLIVSPTTHEIEAVSANAATAFGVSSADQLLGRPIDDFLQLQPPMTDSTGEEFCSLSGAGKATATIRSGSSFSFSKCFLQNGHLLFEFECEPETVSEPSIDLIKDLVGSMGLDEALEYKSQTLAGILRRFSDFDRVMVYHFDQDWNGEVFAEAKREELDSFLHLKYPASDIPPQARDLFFRNQSRIIRDARADAVPLISRKLSAQQIDLSNVLARAVSPIHLQYLENMGVTASFSVPIRADGRLWGLIACHHYSKPRHPSRSLRLAFQVASEIFASAIGEFNRRRRMQSKSEALTYLQELMNQVAKGEDLVAEIEKSSERFLQMTKSTSAWIKVNDQEIQLGQPVSAKTVDAVLKFLRKKDAPSLWSSSRLKDDLCLKKIDKNAAGALAVGLSVGFENALIWFRPEEPEEVHWGGPPSDRVSASREQRLTPRTSFAEWKEVVRGHSRPWDTAELECAQQFLLNLVQDVFARAQTLAVANRELERVNRAKDEFIATLSHELRTPLGIIIGWLDVLRDYQHEDPEVTQAIEIIDRNAKLQVTMINELLDISRIISGKMRVEVRRNIDVTAIISSVIESLFPAASAKSLRIVWKPQGQVTLTADPDRLRQVVWNLLSNALRYTPEGGTVQVRATQLEGAVVIEVEDNGIGIEAEDLGRIFERFSQVNRVPGLTGGLGIGLSIVKGLVELHGGKIRAKSPGLGRGSTFTICFPISDAVAETPQPSPSPQPKWNTQLQGLRVLVVEDQWEALMAMKRLCERNGAQVTTAQTGLEALELLKRENFDLLLSDISMPKMDGYQLIKAWRSEEDSRHSAKLPAIAFTAYATPKDRAMAIQSGFSNHIAKPVNKDHLFTMISSLADQQQH